MPTLDACPGCASPLLHGLGWGELEDRAWVDVRCPDCELQVRTVVTHVELRRFERAQAHARRRLADGCEQLAGASARGGAAWLAEGLDLPGARSR